MSSAPSPIARHLLSQLVDVIPEYTRLEPYRDLNFNNWRKSGSYSLLSANTKSFVLQVVQREYAAVLFAEGQHLLNHAAEHRAHLLNTLSTKREPSPSWTFVTLYYFSLFVAMAWTRASNAAIIYLDKEAIAEFCPGAVAKPGGGAYEIIGRLDPSTGVFSVEFKKCGASHFHEAVWVAINKQTKKISQEIKLQTSRRKTAPDELLALRGLALFDGLSFDRPEVWPSKLRNEINYRPGFSYRSVVKNNFLRTIARLNKPALANLDSVITYGEYAKNSVCGFDDPSDVANECVDLLVAQTVFIEIMTEEVFMHICKIQGLESSALSQRKLFSRNNAVIRSYISPLGYV